MIQEITEFIVNKAGLTRGTDCHMGHRPEDSIINCDTILETGGGSVMFDEPERADPTIQVLSRGTTYLTARNRAWAIYDAIFRDHEVGSAGWTLPNVTIGENYEAMTITPLAPPQYIGQDEHLNYEFSTNYIFRVRKL